MTIKLNEWDGTVSIQITSNFMDDGLDVIASLPFSGGIEKEMAHHDILTEDLSTYGEGFKNLQVDGDAVKNLKEDDTISVRYLYRIITSETYSECGVDYDVEVIYHLLSTDVDYIPKQEKQGIEFELDGRFL